ncbi:MAG: hypothetical protein ABJE47_01225 [bacterium]
MKNKIERVPSKPTQADEYVYRRSLGTRELVPAFGAGLGVAIVTGLAVFYVSKLLLERTPLLPGQRRPKKRLPLGQST